MGSVARATDTGALRAALDAAGLDPTVSDDGGVATAAEPERVGRVAYAAGVVLTELRHTEGGLEDMFLEVTADHQREGKNRERKAA